MQSRDLVLEPLKETEQDAPGPAPMSLVERMRSALDVIVLLALPAAIAILYYGAIATDMYESEASYVVRSVSPSPGLASVATGMSSAQLGRASDDTFVVNAFMTSRDALSALIEKHGLLEALARPEADFVSRFPRPWEQPSLERLKQRLAEFVTVEFDTTTNIGKLTVRAFRAADAQMIANALLQHAEALINRLNARARADAVQFSSEVVATAQKRVEEVQLQIAAFREKELVFDPVRQSAATIELIARLRGQIAEQQASLSEVLTTAPTSPQVAALRSKIAAFEKQIVTERSQIAGSDSAMVPKLGAFEKLSLEREMAIKSYGSALLSLENARNEAQRQQLYLERIVAPNAADIPSHPRRLQSIVAILAVLGCLLWIERLLVRVVMEHDP